MTGGQLGFDFGADVEVRRLVRVTPARLAVWDDCRRRYRLTYLDRPAPPRGGPRAVSTLGAVVHLALRALFALAPAERTPEAGARLVDRNWSSEGFRDAEQAHAYRERAREWVAGYADEHADTEVAGLEQWVSASTARIVVEGRVDRVDRRGDEHVVVDYKTGRRPSEEDVRASRALALYAFAAERALRRRCLRVELHHLPSGTVAAWRHDAASLDAHVRAAEVTAGQLTDAADGFVASGDPDALFPPRTGPRCAACDVRRHCAAGRAAAPEELPWARLGA